jgi:truncated hemoglobin YjbI
MTSPTKISACPFATCKGYSTTQTRQEYLRAHPELIGDDIDESLNADLDTSKPLYFWQIYSLWGQDPFLDIITDFYDSVYNVSERKDLEFRKVFELAASKHHHINAQAAYWIDSMGGGKFYPGGAHRLNVHHHHNAEEVMNADGAKRWMSHMKLAIKHNHHHFQQDPRILTCLIDFLETQMMFYADTHEWEFDASDFQVEHFLHTNDDTGKATTKRRRSI